MGMPQDDTREMQQAGLAGRRPTLSVVMPVHNEAFYLSDTLSDWIRVLRGQQIPFEFLVYDDGSTDGSGEILEECARECAEMRIVHQPNRGHGPSIREGYDAASGEWVFQTDSDDEVPAGEFDQLWPLRERFDFVIGRRVGRKQGFGRRLISKGARLSVRILFGGGVRDVNSPFRLMRGAFLRDSLRYIPGDAFAPNIHLTGLAVRGRWRVREVPVIWQRHGLSGGIGAPPAKIWTLLSVFGEMWTVARRARQR
jgi:dolichol-phosphate mannosyltransferase